MASLGPQPSPFVGRKAETALCREVLSRVIQGRGQALLIEGEPGIGKTALLSLLLRMARSTDCVVLLGRADEMLGTADETTGTGDQSGGYFPMQVMLEVLALDPGDAAVPDLLERVVARVTELCAAGPVVVAIDDMQWADDTSVDAWRRLARLVEGLPLLLTGTCAPTPNPARLAALREELTARGESLASLGPLSPAEVGEMVGVLARGEPSAQLTRLTERAGGNPRYVTELVDALIRAGRLHSENGTADLIRGQELQEVATAITSRLGFLGAQTNRVLRLAALLGKDFTAAEVSAIAGLSPDELALSLAEARAAQIVAEADGRLSFRYQLIQQALYDSTPAALRVALHRQAARALAETGAEDERVAEQLLAIPPSAANDWTRGWLAESGPRLVQRVPGMAAELFQRAVMSSSPADPRRDLLEAALATALLRLDRYHEAIDVARPLLARSQQVEQRAETVKVLGQALVSINRVTEALRLVEEVLDDPDLSPDWRARLHAVIALVQALAGRLAEAEVTARRALADGQRARDTYAVSHALHIISLVRAHESDNTAVEELTSRALAVLGRQPGSADLRCALLLSRMLALHYLGRMAEAEGDLRAAQGLAGDQGGAALRVARAAAEHYLRVGRWDDALIQVDSAAEATDLGRNEVFRHGISALIAGHRDDRATATAHLQAAAKWRAATRAGRLPGSAYLALAQAVAAERQGRPDEAASALRPMLDFDGEPDPRLRYPYLPFIVRLALAGDDRDLAETAAGISEWAAAHETTAIKKAAAAHCQALIERDARPLLAAAQIYRDIGVPLELAQVSEDAAVLLAADGQRLPARQALAEAMAVYAGLGAEWDIRRAETRLRPYGIRRGRGGSRRGAFGWASLTPTEVKIAHMISLGQSTPEIAEDLFVSPRTVQTHVSHILRKLNVRSRADIARISLSAAAGYPEAEG